MGDRLKERVAVVTGAGRGIGRGLCLALAAEGAKVVVNDLGGGPDGSGASREPADRVVEEVRERGGQGVASYDTVATMEGGERIIRTAVDSFGRLDILVHAAGILRHSMVFNMTEQEWDDVINVHLKGMFTTGKHAAILMRQQRSGRIIAFSSTSGLYGSSGQANHGGATDGIAGFVRGAARDLGRYGVTVNCIAPLADTRLTATNLEAPAVLRPRDGIRGTAASASLPRPASEPEDVAPMVLFLCTEKAKDINGQIFFVGGGQISLMNNPYASRTMHKFGLWTIEEIARLYPATLGKGVINPAPPAGPQG